jgi:hypothetical protein
LSNPSLLGRLSDGARDLIRTRGVAMVNERPIVSFTFDGFAKSAGVNAAKMLEGRGAAGTFYIHRSACGATVDGIEQYELGDLKGLIDNGHEIGARAAPAARGHADLSADLDANAEFISAHLGDVRMTTFAFPVGDIDLRTKLWMERRFAACRSMAPGVNAGVADLGALRAENLSSTSADPTTVKDLIGRSSAPHSWLIFFTHDVAQTPGPRGCTPALFEAALESALAAGYEVLPVRNALGRIRFGAKPRGRRSSFLRWLDVRESSAAGRRA